MLVIIYNHFQISEIKKIKRKTTFYSEFFLKIELKNLNVNKPEKRNTILQWVKS